jgi:Phage integrase central domain
MPLAPDSTFVFSRGGAKSFFFSYYSPVDRRKCSLLLWRFDPDGSSGAQWSLVDAVAAWKQASGKVAGGVDPQGTAQRSKNEGEGLVPVDAGASPDRREKLVEVFGDRPLVVGSFGELARDYLVQHAWVEKRRTRDDEQMLARDLLPAWRDRPAVELTRRELVALLDGIISRRGARVVANHVRLLVSRIYNFGIGRVQVDHNPAHLLKPGCPCGPCAGGAPWERPARRLPEPGWARAWAGTRRR